GWLSRDHRKMLTVDGRVGFVFGLCIDQRWRSDPGRGGLPWRDTGIEIRGPAIADLDRAFSQMWAAAGQPLPEEELPDRAIIPQSGDVALRVVAGAPHTAELYRLDLLIAAAARRSLWLTDSYFVGTTPYVQALRAAALNGVDVRLLIPSNSDVPFTRAMTRSGYRPLLEAGIRIFEWNGPMLHAKTAVADGRWGRVGSTNLNLWGWVGNWELDVVAEDESFARAMEQMYQEDLTNAAEIVLNSAKTAQLLRGQERRQRAGRSGRFQLSGRSVTPGVRRIGRVIGMVITNELGFEPSEAVVLALAGLTLLAFVILVIFWPWIAAAPLVFIGGWMALALLVRAYRLYAAGKRAADTRPAGGLSQTATRKIEPKQHEIS
ncbi:MAG TPA: phospholipase D-like domain-containing protein, partial [Blastocatellia bacterium]|nr:phospholipase D-like domain-containing protein [Blastocatellia bacterium]